MSATVRQHDHPDQRKARGAFFTPPALCHHMAAWAIRTPHDRVLEPSCGEAAFLNAAADRLTALGDPAGARLDGVEVHAPSAREARRHLAERGISGRVRVADMFALTPRAAYDVVIGNPPYVRYQDFTGPARAAARQAALRGGVRLSGLASSWAPFVVHVAHFLAPGGRLALVVPAELLSTNYAAEVRSFLMRRFARVRLVVFRERVFPRVQEEVVLLLAEGDGPTDHCELHQVDDLAGLDEMAARARISRWQPEDPTGKWTAALLDEPALAAYRQLLAHPELGTLHDWGETTLGAVTGANRFFALTQTQVDTLGLTEQDLVAISPPGSRHLRRLEFTGAHWESLRDHDRPVWLFRPNDGPSPAGAALIDAGEASGVPRAYKCRTRTPWWRTPIGPPPDLLITYMNADTPRLTRNLAGVRHLNSVHGLHLHAHIPTPAADLLALAALNSLTLLGAETVGRAYGGGLLK
ncbi:MAG TPA: N-6 DNA methylase, partial [Miltoncostaeaceae bacterium]|nr:N-6 DNA methylase [Miltoncostaeaceae bacterium]